MTSVAFEIRRSTCTCRCMTFGGSLMPGLLPCTEVLLRPTSAAKCLSPQHFAPAATRRDALCAMVMSDDAIEVILQKWAWAKGEEAAMKKTIEMCKTQVEKALKERGSMEIITDNYEVKKSLSQWAPEI